MFKPGDKVNVNGDPYSYTIGQEALLSEGDLQAKNPWTVIAVELQLPTRDRFDNFTHNIPQNNTIIRSIRHSTVTFIRSEFLSYVKCPTCGK